jgi:hypothetical protein
LPEQAPVNRRRDFIGRRLPARLTLILAVSWLFVRQKPFVLISPSALQFASASL